MVRREYWIKKLEKAWEKRSIIWLAGVRRVGKTWLCQSLDNIEYFDCELPRIRRTMEDPEEFLRSVEGKRIVLDEIHRLDNPAELLKIAADHYPTTKIVATGSSTLGASKKFRDTLTGRKTRIHLTPMLLRELKDFDTHDLPYRILHGGLPPFFLETMLPETDFQEWLSSYWAKDVQELFRIEKQPSFIKFAELVMAQSGSMFEATRFASPCEVSRTTISNYLSVLEATYVAYVIRPFSTKTSSEIISSPKVFGFDTGFICHCRGWLSLRPEDLGHLWEHIVLNDLKGEFQDIKVNYWRDKQGHEIDFVLADKEKRPITIECKWSASKFEPSNLKIFRGHYPKGENFVVATDVDRSYQRDYDGIKVSFVSLQGLLESL